MRTVQTLSDVPLNALRADAQADGSWLVYETGDTLPELPPSPALNCPGAVTMRQARLALLGAGKLAAVATAINAMSEPAQTAAKITWEYSADVERHNGLVAQLAPALGLTEAQIDALFNAAAAL